MKRSGRCGLALLLTLALGVPGGTPAARAAQTDPNGIAQTLIALLDKQDSTNITADDYTSTSLGQLVTLATPAGYRLKLRYLEFGISLVEALRIARDPDVRKRLIEMVQWAKRPQVRADAIVTLAGLYDPGDKKYLKEALLDKDIGIRFSAVEALQIWKQPDAIPLLRMAVDRDWSPVMRIYASQALLALGDQTALAALWNGLESDSWVVRALSARYLGDYASPDDYTKLVDAMNRETRNDFVTAEAAIAALKLITKKGETVSYVPGSPGWKENEEVKAQGNTKGAIDLPIIIIPPQVKIPASQQAAARINSRLLDLLEHRLGEPLDPAQAQDPVLSDLNAMVTPAGFALKLRYSDLSYLLVEGLAGTNDPLLLAELEKLAREATNPLVKATSLIALAYRRDTSELFYIREALTDKSAIVRFGAMEAIEVGRFKDVIPSLMNVANDDPTPALQVYAMQILAKFGDTSGRLMLISHLSDPDWPARAMAFWYLGRYGQDSDYSMIISRINSEQNPFVQAEIVLAALRLAPVDGQ